MEFPCNMSSHPVKHGWNSHANYWIKGWVFSKKSPLVSVQHSFGESPFLMGKSTIKSPKSPSFMENHHILRAIHQLEMAMFNSYVSLPQVMIHFVLISLGPRRWCGAAPSSYWRSAQRPGRSEKSATVSSGSNTHVFCFMG